MLARLALRAGGRVARLVTDPLSGELLDLTLLGRGSPPARGGWPPGPPPRPAIADVVEPHYEPSEALARFVRARDQRCRYPGCRVPARLCDLDHIVPYDQDKPQLGGQTTARNLCAVCRFHHRLKHSQGWTVTCLPDGTLRWTSPTGQVHETGPPDQGQVA
jgi:hypothetical protein